MELREGRYIEAAPERELVRPEPQRRVTKVPARLIGIGGNGEQLLDTAAGDRRDNAELGQMRPDGVDHRGLMRLSFSPAEPLLNQCSIWKRKAQRDIAPGKAEEARVNVQLAEVALQQMSLMRRFPVSSAAPGSRKTPISPRGARGQSRLATVVQLDPIHVVGRAPAAIYFQRGEKLKSLDQAAEQREFGLILPTSDKYRYKGRLVAGT
jgi:hypothetical protein